MGFSSSVWCYSRFTMGPASSSLRQPRETAWMNSESAQHKIYAVPTVKVVELSQLPGFERGSMPKGSLVNIVKPVRSKTEVEYRPVLCLSDIRPGSFSMCSPTVIYAAK